MMERYNNFREIEGLREDWNLLASRQLNSLASYEWFSTAAQAFHSKDELFIFCVLKNEKLQAVAPLYKSHKRLAGYCLQIIGSRQLYEPMSILYSDNDSLTELIDCIIGSGYSLTLNRIYNDYDLLQSLRKSHCFLNVLDVAGSQYLRFSTNIANYEDYLTGRRRSDLRRAQKKARSHGVVDFRIDFPDSDAVNSGLDAFYRIENAGWKGKNGTSVIRNRAMKQFIDIYSRTSVESQKLVIGNMMIDDKQVAVIIALADKRRLWILKTAYDEDFKKASPGVLLMHEMIKFAYLNRMTGLEFLGSSEAWINLWRPLERKYLTLLCYPFTLRGFSGFFIDLGHRLSVRLRTSKSLNPGSE